MFLIFFIAICFLNIIYGSQQDGFNFKKTQQKNITEKGFSFDGTALSFFKTPAQVGNYEPKQNCSTQNFSALMHVIYDEIIPSEVAIWIHTHQTQELNLLVNQYTLNSPLQNPNNIEDLQRRFLEENNTLTKEQKEHEKSIQKFQSLQAHIKNKLEEKDFLEEERNSLQKTLNQANNELEKTKTLLNEAKILSNAQKTDLSNLQEELTYLKSAERKQKIEANAARKKEPYYKEENVIFKKNNEIDRLNQKIINAKTTLTPLEQKVENLQQEIEILKKEKEKLSSTAEDKYKDQLLQKINKLKEDIGALKEATISKTEHTTTLSERNLFVTQLEKKINELQLKNQKQNAELLEKGKKELLLKKEKTAYKDQLVQINTFEHENEKLKKAIGPLIKKDQFLNNTQIFLIFLIASWLVRDHKVWLSLVNVVRYRFI
jgi:DNA repair exonuclease SbcCD ATPase subunit